MDQMNQMYQTSHMNQMNQMNQSQQTQPNQMPVFNQSQPGMTMPEPPAVVSLKDGLYLKDALSWELTAMKKCQHFAQECNDPEIKSALDFAGRLHQRHYQILLNHLNPANKANM